MHSLGIRRNGLGDAEAALLAASPHVGRLRWLGLADNEIGSQGSRPLAGAPSLRSPRYVAFRHNATADPTPQFADEYDSDSPLATELQAKYGPRPGLSVKGHPVWPPPLDAD